MKNLRRRFDRVTVHAKRLPIGLRPEEIERAAMRDDVIEYARALALAPVADRVPHQERMTRSTEASARLQASHGLNECRTLRRCSTVLVAVAAALRVVTAAYDTALTVRSAGHRSITGRRR
jgi:hypothetical protein